MAAVAVVAATLVLQQILPTHVRTSRQAALSCHTRGVVLVVSAPTTSSWPPGSTPHGGSESLSVGCCWLAFRLTEEVKDTFYER